MLNLITQFHVRQWHCGVAVLKLPEFESSSLQISLLIDFDREEYTQ
jgi:hypothetical protein